MSRHVVFGTGQVGRYVVEELVASGADVTALFVDRDNRIWCGGEDAGLNLLGARRTGFRHFRHAAGNPANFVPLGLRFSPGGAFTTLPY